MVKTTLQLMNKKASRRLTQRLPVRQRKLHNRVGMLAQLVEQRTFNPFVVGSTPAHPTRN